MTLNCFGFLMCIMISDGSAFVYVVVLLLILTFLRKSYFLTGKELKRLESESINELICLILMSVF